MEKRIRNDSPTTVEAYVRVRAFKCARRRVCGLTTDAMRVARIYSCRAHTTPREYPHIRTAHACTCTYMHASLSNHTCIHMHPHADLGGVPFVKPPGSIFIRYHILPIPIRAGTPRPGNHRPRDSKMMSVHGISRSST